MYKKITCLLYLADFFLLLVGMRMGVNLSSNYVRSLSITFDNDVKPPVGDPDHVSQTGLAKCQIYWYLKLHHCEIIFSVD